MGMYEPESNFKIKLYDYQKKSLNKMISIEKNLVDFPTKKPGQSRVRRSQKRSVELLFFGRTRQGFDAGRTTLNDSGDVVKIACADFLLMRDKSVALLTSCKLGLLDHVHIMLHAFSISVGMCKLECIEPIDMNTCQSDELVLVTKRGQIFLEGCNLLVVEIFLPIE